MTLALAMLLDALLGEPKWLWSKVPHPAVLIGNAIAWMDERFNTGTQKTAKGVVMLIILSASALILGVSLHLIPGRIVDIIVLAVLLAQRSLSDHVLDVAKALRSSTTDARLAVAQIVGRDTKDMDDSAIARSAIESCAENFSDGVVAPIFWFLIGGLPGVLLYKATNTADSMVGYRSEKYREFGWAAARFDDILNYIPARLSALIIAASMGRFDVLGEVTADAPKHRSPNAGWPEAAMAHTLNIALSGPRSYDGKITSDPFVNEDGIRELNSSHIGEAVRVIWQAWALVLIPTVAAWWFIGQ